MVKAAILQFRAMGLEPAIYRTGVSSIHKRVNKTGYFGTSVNPQYDFDHRMDQGLYLDRPLMERRLAMLRVAYEQFADLASVYAGPAVIETFGQAQEELESKSQAIALSKKQQKVWVEYQNEAGMLTNQYIPSDQYSFTIIAYPIPEIGVDFAEIFAETVAVNTLDPSKYEKIQQCLIDALDQGQYVTIKGKGTNQTDLKVQLQEISEPAKQTGFENCLADVNIPVGEVFTSPKLEGTQGRLHVHSVYLNGLHYQDLDLQFQDGEVVAYTCKNFESEEKNKALIRDNVLYQHQTLPMGEFAIGTNTTAYAMGKKYGISGKLPILIAEKTGPHFALGDTCYSMSEDNQVYNPDGKEMIAKENSYSLLRHEKPEEAYFHCHTDITIPYEELEEIAVYTKAGEKIALIQDGRFCLPGTEKLNLPLGE
ncbi:MAG: aminopeptidase, partial [Lachnospiraceae bacterium]|nr:aminopeptidase [Lachnospiraceae bacterium]